MDNIDNEEALGNISRQLSELATAPSSPELPPGASPILDGQWTQFSGISPQAGNAPFRNLYTWNPMDLPDFKPLSPPTINASSSNTSTVGGMPGLGDHVNLLNQGQSQPEWQRQGSGSQRFHVAGDLAGRLVDTTRRRAASTGFDEHNYSYPDQNSFHPSDHIFQSDGIRRTTTHMPAHRQMSQPLTSTSNLFMSSDGLGMPSAHSSSNMPTMSQHLIGGTMGSDGFNHGMPPDGSLRARLLQTPPVFDPRTPPPVFPIQRHHVTENQHQASPVAPNTSHEDVLNYLRLQGQANINLDLGINVDRGSRQNYAEAGDNISTSDEGRMMYESAMKQWHTFDSSLVPSGNVNSVVPEKQENVPEVPTSSDPTKPSYSDIAKTPKSGMPSGTRVDQQNLELQRGQEAKVKKREGKPFRPAVQRTSSGTKFWPKGAVGSDTDHPRMSPTSKYGLDNFDDLCPGSHSSSSESLVQATARSRRGSGSSVGSAVSALDDITHGVAPHTSFSESDAHQDHASSTQEHKHGSGSHRGTPSKPPPSSKPSSASSSPASKEGLFFDPRRIFKDTNKSRAQTSGGGGGSKSRGNSLDASGPISSYSDTILNNGKPTSGASFSSKLSSTARQHDYINNDLRDSGAKLTNQTTEGGYSSAPAKSEEEHKHRESRSGKKSGGRTNGVHSRRGERRKSPSGQTEEAHTDQAHHQQHRLGLLAEHVDREKLEEWCSLAWEKVSLYGNAFIYSLLSFLIYMLGLILYLASGAVHVILMSLSKCWTLIKEKLFKGYFGGKSNNGWNSRDHLRRRVGLEENISLPGTGEDAMKRLLACKGKDPYSILGLRADSSDEDIKRYYRKQAVLVHPDKNQEPGAEEAFKILGHAFEMIGETTKRKQYDSHTQEANEAEAMREFAEMLSKLQTKIQEAANIMRCDNCGGKHRRVPVDRPFYSARFCERCNTRHSAKEGDVWAESTMLGFYWHYYALMEGHVFDITEWMKCHKEYFKHMKANAHGVMYRIATDGNNRRNNKHHQSGEANLEDFINRLFNKSSAASGDGQGPSWGASGGDNSWTQGGTTSAAAAAKKGRRKKKRH